MPVYSNWIKRLNLKFSVAIKGDRGSSPCAGVIKIKDNNIGTKLWVSNTLNLVVILILILCEYSQMEKAEVYEALIGSSTLSTRAI